MFENESDYFEALGLEAPAEETSVTEEDEKEPQAVSAPEDDMFPDEAAGNESTAEEGNDLSEGTDSEEDPEPDADGEKPPQTLEERARNAERRRRAETEAAIAAAVEAERQRSDREIGALLKIAGFKDGDNRIENAGQLRAFLAKQAAQRLESEEKNGNVSAESLQNAVRAELAVQRRAQLEAARRKNDQRAFFRQVDAELREIQKYDPEIKSPADFQKLDRFDAFSDAVQNHGHSFLDAYRFVYADRIAGQRARQAARQAAQRTRNNDRSKEHLRSSGTAGSGDVTVPAQVERNIRAIMPNASAKKIRQYYQKYNAQTGGK